MRARRPHVDGHQSQRWESNPQPPHYECGALPIEATLARARPLPTAVFPPRQRSSGTPHTSAAGGHASRVRAFWASFFRPHPAPAPGCRLGGTAGNGPVVRPRKNQGGASDPTGASCHGRAGQGQGDRTSGIKSEAPPVIGLGCRDVSATTPEMSCILRAKVSSDCRRGRGGFVPGKNLLITVRGWSRSRSPTG